MFISVYLFGNRVVDEYIEENYFMPFVYGEIEVVLQILHYIGECILEDQYLGTPATVDLK